MSTLSCHFNQNYNEQTIVSDYMPEKPLAIFLRRIFKECQKKIPFQTTAKKKKKSFKRVRNRSTIVIQHLKFAAIWQWKQWMRNLAQSSDVG